MACSRIGRFCESFRRSVTIEPYTFVFFGGFFINAVASFPLFYSKICRSEFDATTCANLFDHPDVENRVQWSSSLWTAYLELARFLPTWLSTMLLSTYADHHSFKLPALISVGATVGFIGFYIVFVAIDAIPVYTQLLVGVLFAFGAPITLFMSCQLSFLAQAVKDRHNLTLRYSILSACMSLALIIGNNAATGLFAVLSYYWVMVAGEALLVALFFVMLFRYPHRAPGHEADETRSRRSAVDIQSVDGNVTPSASTSTLSLPSKARSTPRPSLISDGLKLYRTAWSTLLKPRRHNRRLHLWILCAVGAIFTSQDVGLVTVTTLYAYKRPLSWTPSMLAVWTAVLSFIEMVGSIVSAYFFSRWRVPPPLVVMLSLCSALLKMVTLATATTTWQMYLALVLGCLTAVGYSGMQTYVVSLGQPEEAVELIACLTAVGAFIPAFSVLVYNVVYMLTLDTFPGSPFLVCAGFLVLCGAAVSFTYFDHRRLLKKDPISPPVQSKPPPLS